MHERTASGNCHRKTGTALECTLNRCDLHQASWNPCREMPSVQLLALGTHSNHR